MKNIVKIIICFVLVCLILLNFYLKNLNKHDSNSKNEVKDISFEAIDYSYSTTDGSSLTLLIANNTNDSLIFDGFKVIAFNSITNKKEEVDVVIYAKLKQNEEIKYVVDTKKVIVGDDITLEYVANTEKIDE
jgi:glucose uptake protein GlcU